MFKPRLVTFLVMLGCTSLAGILYSEYLFAFPFAWMKNVSAGAGASFALSALVMLIGTFGMEKSNDGALIMRQSMLGKVMRFIVGNHKKEIHCCDIYINVTAATLATMGLAFLLSAFSYVFIYLPFKAGWTEFGFLLMGAIIVSAILVACVGITIFLLRRLLRIPHVEKLLVCISIAAGVYVIAILVSQSYLFLKAFFESGIPVLPTIGFTITTLAILCLPFGCIAGKKLLFRTRHASEICPVVRL